MDENKVQIKIEPDTVVVIKPEHIASYNLEDESKCIPISADCNYFSNNVPKLKTEPEVKPFYQENDVKVKIEYDSSDDLSDHFIETCTKFEKLAEYDVNNYDNSIDDRDYTKAYIKEDTIEVEEHQINTKCEKLAEYDANNYDNSIDDRDYTKAYIKEDTIEVEEHQIKLETFESIEINIEDTNHDNPKTPKVKILQCSYCSYQTPTPSSLKKHVALHQDPSTARLYFCTKCIYRSRQKCHLKRHDLIHQSEIVKFECAICDFKTKQKCTLKRHIDSVHVGSTKSANINAGLKSEVFACNECSYATYKKGLLISHMDKHKDTSNVTNLFICDICSFSTKYRRNLRVHLETHKESPVLQTYECELCSFRTRLGYCLKRHLLSRKHLLAAGKINEYCPRTPKL